MFPCDDSYFFKIAGWIISTPPGIYQVNKLAALPNLEKFVWHIKWYRISRPEGFNRVEFLDNNVNEIEIIYESEYIKRNYPTKEVDPKLYKDLNK